MANELTTYQHVIDDIKGIISSGIHSAYTFYLYFPDEEILNTRVPNLTWTHFRSLLRVPDVGQMGMYVRMCDVP